MLDFTTILLDLDDKPIREETGTDEQGKKTYADVTLGRAARNALQLPYQDEQGLSGDDKVKRFMLAVKATGKGVTLTAEETALIKKVIAKAYGPLIVGRSYQHLDPASMPVEKRGNGAVDPHNTALDIADDGRVTAIR